MKLSLEVHSLRAKMGDQAALNMIKEAGFDAYDYSLYNNNIKRMVAADDYIEQAKAVRAYADSIGLVCNQSHGPFDFKYSDDFNMENANFRGIVRSLEFASILGAPNMVLHAIKELPTGVDFYEYNRKFYKSFEPYCEKFGVCISVENLFRYNVAEKKYDGVLSDPKEHLAFVESLESPWFNICVDVGHSNITGYNPVEVIRAMNKDVLKAIHIHDNDSFSDSHMLPYTGNINWNGVMDALHEIGYTGDFTFEVLGVLDNVHANMELMPATMKYTEAIGRSLIAKFENR